MARCMLFTRYAEKDDLPLVYSMYIAALAERESKINENKAMEYVLFCWSQAPCVLLLKEEEIIGFAGLKTIAIPFNDVVVLGDYMFYIVPKSRGIISWRTLCKAVRDVSDRFKLAFVGEHLLDTDIKTHLKMIELAGAKPKAILSVYGESYGK